MSSLVKWLAACIFVTGLQACATPGASNDPRLSALERVVYEAPGLPGAEISSLRAGDEHAPRVIYIHGTPGDATAFAAYLTDPVDGLEAVSIDRPGFGETTPRGAVPSLHEQAAAIEPLLVERDGKWPILVGHSLGGPIAARVAAEEPDRVGGLVIVAGALDPDLEHVMAIQRVGDFLFIPLLLPRWARNANRELIPLKGELRELAPMLRRVTCPVIIIHGTDDSLVPYSNVAYMESAFTSAPVEVIRIDGADHFLPWKHEGVIRDAIGRLRDGD